MQYNLFRYRYVLYIYYVTHLYSLTHRDTHKNAHSTVKSRFNLEIEVNQSIHDMLIWDLVLSVYIFFCLFYFLLDFFISFIYISLFFILHCIFAHFLFICAFLLLQYCTDLYYYGFILLPHFYDLPYSTIFRLFLDIRNGMEFVN